MTFFYLFQDQGDDGEPDHQQIKDAQDGEGRGTPGDGGDHQGRHVHHGEEQGGVEELAVAHLQLLAREGLAAGILAELGSLVLELGGHQVAQLVEQEGRQGEDAEPDERGDQYIPLVENRHVVILVYLL